MYATLDTDCQCEQRRKSLTFETKDPCLKDRIWCTTTTQHMFQSRTQGVEKKEQENTKRDCWFI